MSQYLYFPNDITRLILSYTDWKRYGILCEFFEIKIHYSDLKKLTTLCENPPPIDVVCDLANECRNLFDALMYVNAKFTKNSILNACARGHIYLLKQCIKLFNVKVLTSIKVMDVAINTGNLKIIKLLFKKYNLEITDTHKSIICYRGYTSVLVYLLKNDITFEKGHKHVAMLGNHHHIIKILESQD